MNQITIDFPRILGLSINIKYVDHKLCETTKSGTYTKNNSHKKAIELLSSITKKEIDFHWSTESTILVNLRTKTDNYLGGRYKTIGFLAFPDIDPSLPENNENEFYQATNGKWYKPIQEWDNDLGIWILRIIEKEELEQKRELLKTKYYETRGIISIPLHSLEGEKAKLLGLYMETFFKGITISNKNKNGKFFNYMKPPSYYYQPIIYKNKIGIILPTLNTFNFYELNVYYNKDDYFLVCENFTDTLAHETLKEWAGIVPESPMWIYEEGTIRFSWGDPKIHYFAKKMQYNIEENPIFFPIIN